MFMSPLESGDRQNSIRMSMRTRHGNSSARGNGIESDESLVSRMRRVKKLVREARFSARRGLSSTVFSGLSLVDGSRLVTSGNNAIAASTGELYGVRWQRQVPDSANLVQATVCEGWSCFVNWQATERNKVGAELVRSDWEV